MAPTGVEVTAQLGVVGPVLTVALTGVEATGEVGSVDIISDVVIPITGVEATTQVGSVQFTESGSVNLTGAEATGAVGAVSIGPRILPITGVEATSAVGNVVGQVPVKGTFYVDEQVIISRTETNAPLWIGVDDTGGVAGLSVTAQIRDGATTTSYLDFADDTFKTSAWSQKSLTLTDIGNGYYTDTLDVSAITNLPSTDHLSLEYTISGSVAGIAQGTLSFDQAAAVVFANVMEDGETFEQSQRLQRAAAAGSIVQQPDGSYVIKSKDGLKDRIEGDDAANDGRTISTTDSS